MNNTYSGEIELIGKYKAKAIKYRDKLIETKINYEGFEAIYHEQQKRYLINRFFSKFGSDGWLEIRTTNRPDLEGIYRYSIDTTEREFVRYQYIGYGNPMGLDASICLQRFAKTSDGYMRSYLEDVFFNPDFLFGNGAVKCQKPTYRERKAKTKVYT